MQAENTSRENHLAVRQDTTQPRTDKPTSDTSFEVIMNDVDETLLDANLLENFLSKRLVASYRVVTVDTDNLREFLRGDTSIANPELELVDGYSVNVKTIKSNEYTDGWQNGMATWVGKIVGDDIGGATFVVTPEGGIDATITSSQGRYKIEGLGQGRYHVVWLMDLHDPIAID